MRQTTTSFRLGLALAATLILAACGGAIQYLPDSDPHPGVARAHRMPVQGIDVSKYQGDIDWAKVRDDDIRFAYMKVSEGGDHVDERFYENWEKAARAGVPRGAYHFMYWCRTASEQALWYQMAVPRDKSQLPPVLDLEWNHQSRTCPHKISKEEALQKIDVMLAAMEAHSGKRPIIYTDITFHKDILEGRYRNYDFWLRSVAAEPHERYKHRAFLIWQYSATGRVRGISGPVDRNAFNGSEKEFERWLRRQGAS
ncbi:glycoside hydrolase family 25 protein [Afifella pfennigii]|uniref:glycoside hydrolase family 25 protein n=1 Tax=Afifella pfennigii TaxID=209897 RepID=UPI0006894C1B|nr:GH25 family lysozyme [Afifella pfennigii]